MKKLKTHKATSKRVKLTGSGKIIRNKQQHRNNSHLKNARKSTKKVLKDRLVITSKAEIKKIKRLLNI